MSQGRFETVAKPSGLAASDGQDGTECTAIGFRRLGADFLGLRMRRGRSDVGDPVGAAGDGEGMRANRGHVFVGPRSPVGECRLHICSNRNDLFGKLSDQVG